MSKVWGQTDGRQAREKSRTDRWTDWHTYEKEHLKRPIFVGFTSST